MKKWRVGVIMGYAIVIEKAQGNYSAYVPDLPGCVSVGNTILEVKQNIQEAISFHIEGMQEEGLPIPSTSSNSRWVVRIFNEPQRHRRHGKKGGNL